MSICFWQSDLLLFGQGLRLLAICRFACGSLTSLRWRMRELARAAIFPALTLPPPHQPLAARWRPGVGGYRGPPPCPLTQGDGAPLREGCRAEEGASEDGPEQRGREAEKEGGGGGRRGGGGGKKGGSLKGPPKNRQLSLVEVWIYERLSLNVLLLVCFLVGESGLGEALIRHCSSVGTSHVVIHP